MAALPPRSLEPEIQVLPKRPLRHPLFQVPVGRRDHPQVRLARDVLSQPLVFLFLQQPQQLGLDLHRQIPDLIQKQGAAAAALTLPQRSLTAPVKAPLVWPKSSLSNNSLDRLGQLTVTSGLSARWLC